MSEQSHFSEIKALAPVLLDALTVPFLVCDAQGLIVLVNSVAQKQLNAQVGDILSGPLPKLAEAVGAFRRSATTSPPLTILRGSGAPYLALLSTVKATDGRTLTLCLLPPAPTEPDAERRMLDFEAMTLELHAIIDSSSDGLFVCDADGNVIRVNPASEKNSSEAGCGNGRAQHARIDE